MIPKIMIFLRKFQCREFSPTETLLFHDYDDCVKKKNKAEEKNPNY